MSGDRYDSRYGRDIPDLSPPLEPWELDYFYREIPERVRQRETVHLNAYGEAGQRRAGGNTQTGPGLRYWGNEEKP